MHAIIRQGDGKFYISAVYGYYEDNTAIDDYDRYLEQIYKPYWIIWDPEKKRLIRWQTTVPDGVHNLKCKRTLHGRTGGYAHE